MDENEGKFDLFLIENSSAFQYLIDILKDYVIENKISTD